MSIHDRIMQKIDDHFKRHQRYPTTLYIGYRLMGELREYCQARSLFIYGDHGYKEYGGCKIIEVTTESTHLSVS